MKKLLLLILLSACAKDSKSGPDTCDRELQLCKTDVQAWKAKADELQKNLNDCTASKLGSY